MKEPDRLAQNAAKLLECNPFFRVKLARTIERLETEANPLTSKLYRPRIQQAARTPAEQKTLKAGGTSKLSWGYHNATTPEGLPDSLAADVLDDDNPIEPPVCYKLRLGTIAREEGLSTGVDWMPKELKPSVWKLMAAGATSAPEGQKWGWDPNHVEWVGISVLSAKRGVRPTT